MPQDDVSAAASAWPPFQTGWPFGLLPAFLGGTAAGQAAGVPSGADPLKLTRDLVDALYGGYLRMLTAGRPGGEPGVLQELLQGRGNAVAEQFSGFVRALSGHSAFASLGQWLAGTPSGAMGDALKPLALNIEHAYGGLADAFGLAPMRDFDQARQEMVSAALAHRKAQADYFAVVAGAFGKGAEASVARLAEMSRRGESIDTLLALLRLWAQATDKAMHEAMQSPPALKASSELVRAAARLRQQQQRVVVIASEALHMPTRVEMDDAYREIQELKRELRRLRKAAAPVEPLPAGKGPKPRAGIKAKATPRKENTA